MILIACLASVSVWFRSNERPRNGILGFGPVRNETRAKKWKWGKGEGKEGTQAWQAKWVVFRIPGFVCKRFLPFFPTHSPLFYLRHFSRGLWLVPRSLLLNRTEMLATQARMRVINAKERVTFQNKGNKNFFLWFFLKAEKSGRFRFYTVPLLLVDPHSYKNIPIS